MVELDERIEALEKELASIKGNLHATLEQIRDSLASQRQRPVSEPSASEEQVQVEDVPARKKDASSKAVSKRPRGGQKASAEPVRDSEADVPGPDAVQEQEVLAHPSASEQPRSLIADLPSHLDRKLTDLDPDELESILDMYVRIGYLPSHTRRLMTRILHPAKVRRSGRSGISLWDCISAATDNNDADLE